MQKNKVTTYLLYAIGEIILVVIGILIALQINNWNEEKANERKVLSHLKEISTKLGTEIENAKSVIQFYNKRDTLLSKVISDQFTHEDFKCSGPFCPQYAITLWTFIEVNRNAYNNLVLMSGDIPDKFRDLYQELNVLYDVNAEYLLVRNSKLSEKITAFGRHLNENKAWHYKFVLGNIEEDAITYFLEDPFYKNYVMEYVDDAHKLRSATSNYLEQATVVDSLINTFILE